MEELQLGFKPLGQTFQFVFRLLIVDTPQLTAELELYLGMVIV